MTRVLAPIQEELVHLREGLQVVGAAVKAVEASNQELKDAVEDLQDSNAHIRRIAAIVESLTPSFPWFVVDQIQTWNRTSGNGKDGPLEVVPFPSGQDPTKPPVCLLNSCLFDVALKPFPSAQSTSSFFIEEIAGPHCWRT
jgi:hypothetical protein